MKIIGTTLKRIVVTACAFACLNGNAHAKTLLYGVTFWSGELVRIDLQTGISVTVGNVGSSYDIAPYQGSLYIFNGNSIRQVEDGTGQVISTQAFPNAIPGGEGAFAWRSDGLAMGTRSSNSTGTLFRIDFANSKLQLVTVPGALRPSLDGLAFDATGALYGLQQNVAGDYGLYAVNVADGTTELIGRLGVSFSSANGTVAGLAFAPDGSLYAAVGNQTASRLYQVNKTTGAAISSRTISAPGLSGIAFLEGLGPLMAERAGEQIRVSWPHRFGGTLESTLFLNALWQPFTVSIATNGLDVFTLVEPEDPQRFFRLVE